MGSAAPPPAGRVLGDRYELVRHLARGASADVYEAVDRVLERPVAVKVCRAASAIDRRRFDTEMLVMAGLSHRALVEVYDAGEQDGEGFLVLELVDGADLRSILDARGALPSHEVVALGSELAGALDHVHRRGVVHGDVRPANVRCGPDGRPRLTDFGSAGLLGPTQVPVVADTSATAGYRAPEQVRGERVGPPADVYALGLVLREALTGTPAFDGEPHEPAVAGLTRDPDTATGIAPRWRPLLREMTAREPAARPSAATVQARLAQAVPGAGPATDGADTTTTTTIASVRDDGTAVMPAAQLGARSGERGPAADGTRRARRLVWGAVAAVGVALCTAVAARGGGVGEIPATTSSTTPVVAAPSTTLAPPTTAAPAPAPPAEPDDDDDDDDEERPGKGKGRGKGRDAD